MTDLADLVLQVDAGGDAEEHAEITTRLRTELLDLDVAAVDWVDERTAPDGAKGVAGLAKALIVRLGEAGALRAVVNAVRSWATRTNRTVEVSMGGDVLKLTGVTSAQQEKIIDVWLARHAAGA